MYSVKRLLLVSGFNQQDFFLVKLEKQNFTKILRLGTKTLYADRRIGTTKPTIATKTRCRMRVYNLLWRHKSLHSSHSVYLFRTTHAQPRVYFEIWDSHSRIATDRSLPDDGPIRPETCQWCWTTLLLAHSNRTVCICCLNYSNYPKYSSGVRGGRSWLRHCATSRKARVRFPMVSLEFFIWLNPSSRTMALGLTQPLTEMSTTNICWG